MKIQDGETLISSQAQTIESWEGWHQKAFKDIESRLADPAFPCVFSRNAYRKKLLRFIFVADAEIHSIRRLADGLREYVELSQNWDRRLDTAYPLLVVFAPGATDARTVDEYHAFGWRVLQQLHDLDPGHWPHGVSRDPESDAWSMCFAGMPLFCNMSNPGHRTRRSRDLGDHFVLVVNPRERFDVTIHWVRRA